MNTYVKRGLLILFTLTFVLLSFTTYTSAASKKEAKKVVAIDAGHQAKGNNALEYIGPGSKTKKAKVASGTRGSFTKVPEYKLTLAVAKKLKAELIQRGYTVIMTREKNNVNISNKKRALLANQSGADLCIRLHADGSTSSSASGASALYPSTSNPYVSTLSKKSKFLSSCILNSMCDATGARNRGLLTRDDLTGTNWSTIPVTLIEMGFMTNQKEDKQMNSKSYQEKIVQGIADGIDAYYP